MIMKRLHVSKNLKINNSTLFKMFISEESGGGGAGFWFILGVCCTGLTVTDTHFSPPQTPHIPLMLLKGGIKGQVLLP